MSILERLNKDMVTAMKNKEKDRLGVIRMVKASLQNEAIKQGKPLEESDELGILSREVKQRKDSINEFEKANRQDLVDQLVIELNILADYLPKQLTPEEIEQTIQEVAQQLNITSAKEMGKLMGGLMPKVKGMADGQLVNQLVKEYLSKL